MFIMMLEEISIAFSRVLYYIGGIINVSLEFKFDMRFRSLNNYQLFRDSKNGGC